MASNKRSDGDGSIYYDESRKRHIGSLVVDWIDGKPVRRKVSAKSRADCARKLRELRDKANAGVLTSGKVPTVAEWMRYWHAEIAPHKVRETTLPGYGSYIENYLVPLLGSHRLDRLRPEHIEKAWRFMLDVGRPGAAEPAPLSPTTVLQAHRILSRALKVASQRRMIALNPATLVEPPSRVDAEIKPLAIAEAKRVLAAAAGDPRTEARWTVALSLGLRQGEALGLTWDSVNLEEGVIYVRAALARIRGKGLTLVQPKSRSSRRAVKMPAQLLAQMKAHRKAQSIEKLAAGSWWGELDLVFCTPEGKPIDQRADWQAWKDLLAAAEVPDYRLHDARHTAATLLLAQGVPLRTVMDILGHSQVSVTMRYLHVVDEMKNEAADLMGRVLWGD